MAASCTSWMMQSSKKGFASSRTLLANIGWVCSASSSHPYPFQTIVVPSFSSSLLQTGCHQSGEIVETLVPLSWLDRGRVSRKGFAHYRPHCSSPPGPGRSFHSDPGSQYSTLLYTPLSTLKWEFWTNFFPTPLFGSKSGVLNFRVAISGPTPYNR